jgi:large subunit ribosomal protein L2
MLKRFRPRTPGLRQLILSTNDQLTRVGDGRATVKPCKSLLRPKTRGNGRNNTGRITCRHRGGGHKRHIRIVDFRRDKLEVPAKVASIEYDPNRTAFIALLHYTDGEKRYIIAPKDLNAGMTVQTSEQAPFKPGNCMTLKAMPVGSVVYNIELVPGRGGKMVRAAGQSAQLLGRTNGYATLRLPSGEVRMVPEACRATFGVVSNSEHSLRNEGKAGRNRWKGIRPTVRGTAMNPVDHPHGGGEGRSRGNIPQTPWAKCTTGMRTRSTKKSSKRFIVKDRRKK